MSLPPFPTSASLYVGDLSSDVSEVHLFDVFNPFGSVASLRVCRDAVTRRSLGYAYVNFHHPQDAESAMEHLNNSPIKGKSCRIMWSQRDPSIRKSGVGNIFIKNLEKSIDRKSLHDTFSAFGNILSCKIDTDENGNSRGFGFVHFESQESADQAIEKVNNMSILGQTVSVNRFIPKKERMKTREQHGFTNLFVKNFDESFDQDSLRALFSTYGEISSCVVATDENGKSKGFGFVSFNHAEDARKAMEALTGTTVSSVASKPLYVSRAQKKAERQSELRNKFKTEMASKYQGVNLYIKNLSDDIDGQKLREEFTPFGSVTSCEVMKDDKGYSKGFGFVCFSSSEEANKACTEMNGRILGTKPIYVALAQRKDARRAQLAAQHAQRLKSMTSGAPFAPSNMFPGQAAPLYTYPQAGGMPQQYVLQPQMVQQQQQQQQQQNRRNWAAHPQYPQIPAYMMNVPRNTRGYNNRQASRGRGGGGGGSAPNAGSQNPRAPKDNNQASFEPNHDSFGAPPPPSPPPPPMPDSSSSQATNANVVKQATVDSKNSVVGDRLYELVFRLQPDLAGKITGMLLESCDAQVLHSFFEDEQALLVSVNEAVTVLERHAAEHSEQ